MPINFSYKRTGGKVTAMMTLLLIIMLAIEPLISQLRIERYNIYNVNVFHRDIPYCKF